MWENKIKHAYIMCRNEVSVSFVREWELSWVLETIWKISNTVEPYKAATHSADTPIRRPVNYQSPEISLLG